ncbi:MAG TPA: PEP-CTERM sorting domain-containing protein [Candidatus Limnocylindria bacterium]|nr:PEP-CTERM sorting domain-containing protein [Candidatus Limnocylindria bacterium]
MANSAQPISIVMPQGNPRFLIPHSLLRTEAVALALSVVTTAFTVTAGELDQQYLPSSANALIVEQSQTVAQTFGIAHSGVLDRVAVELLRNPELPAVGITLELRHTLLDGTPAPTSIASFSIAADAIGVTKSFLEVDFSGVHLDVLAGDKLALVLSCELPGKGGIDPFAWSGGAPGTYAGGKAYIDRGTGLSPVDWDLGFETYVTRSPAVVPEPSTLAFLGAWAGALYFLKRRFHR